MRLPFALVGNKKGDWSLVPISATTGGLNSDKYVHKVEKTIRFLPSFLLLGPFFVFPAAW